MNPPLFTEGVSDTSDADEKRFGGRDVPTAPAPDKAGPRGQSRSKPPQNRGPGPSAERGPRPGGGQFELSEDRINGIMAGIKQLDPDKAKELEALRKSDPEAFKTQLRDYISKKMRQMRGRPGGGGGPGSRPGQRGAGGG